MYAYDTICSGSLLGSLQVFNSRGFWSLTDVACAHMYRDSGTGIVRSCDDEDLFDVAKINQVDDFNSLTFAASQSVLHGQPELKNVK